MEKLPMRKVIFTTIVLLVLGTAWMLYLDHKNERFIENLPKPPVTVKHPVDTIEAPPTAETSESISVESMPSEISVRHTNAESEHTHPHSHTSEPTETSEKPFETFSFEDMVSDIDAGSTENAPLDNQGLSAEAIEERRRARETINRLMMNPDNWIEGKPGEVGFTFTLSKEENEAFLEAGVLLNPTPANKQALEQTKNPQSGESETPAD